MIQTSVDIAKLIELAGLRGRPEIEALAAVSAVSKNPHWQQLLLKVVEPLAAMAPEAQPFPAPAELPNGVIPLGTALMMNGQPYADVTLPSDALTAHVLVCGTTGAGKSMLLSYLILNLNLSGFTTLVIDTENEYAKRLVPILRDMAVIGWKQMRRNFHTPIPGEEVADALEQIRRLMREEWLRENGLAVLSELLHQEYAVQAEWNTYPTVSGMLDRMDRVRRRYGSRLRDAFESLRARYQSLQDLVTYRCQEGMPIKHFIEKSTIIEMRGLSPEHLGFVVRELLSSVARHLEQEPPAKPLIVVMDEASRVINKKLDARADTGDPIIFDLLRSLRKRHGAFIFADQIVSQLPTHVLALCGTRIALLQGSGVDATALGSAMSLSREQAAYLLALPFRRSVVHSPKWLSPSAFLMELPELAFPEASEAEIKQRIAASLEGLEWTPLRQAQEDMPIRQPRVERAKPSVLVRKAAQDYLGHIAQYSFFWATQRDRMLGLSVAVGNDRRNELLEAKLIRLHRLHTGRRGGSYVLTEITDDGYRYLQALKIGFKKPRGRGSYVHKACQHFIAEFYRREEPGAVVMIEDDTSGHAVDVSVLGEEKIAVEVLITDENKEIGSIDENLRHYDRVVMVSDDPEMLEQLKEKVEQSFERAERERISYQLVAEFLEKKKVK